MECLEMLTTEHAPCFNYSIINNIMEIRKTQQALYAVLRENAGWYFAADKLHSAWKLYSCNKTHSVNIPIPMQEAS
jgi:hypothetical protein